MSIRVCDENHVEAGERKKKIADAVGEATQRPQTLENTIMSPREHFHILHVVKFIITTLNLTIKSC